MGKSVLGFSFLQIYCYLHLMKKIGYVYMITCIVTGRKYIGSTNDIKRRFTEYKAIHSKDQVKLYRSLKKYGTENHIFEEIWKGDIELMLEKEAILGNWFNVLDKKEGLNLRLPYIGEKYNHFSDEARKNISNARKGWKPKPESIAKMVKTKKANGISEENRAKMVANLPRGIPRSKEVKEKISASNMGKIMSDEAKWNMSNKLICTETGKIMTVEQVAELYNYTTSHVGNMIRGHRNNKTSFILLKSSKKKLKKL